MRDNPRSRPTSGHENKGSITAARHWRGDPSARLTSSLSKDGYRVALVEQDGQVAGCAFWMYLQGTNFGRLDYVAVHPDFRRRGIGEALVVQANSDARNTGAHAMYLSLRSDNATAHRLYLRCGYTGTVRSTQFRAPGPGR
jgi:ribosomal protein S18 acetylase RimI-like enzyme